MYPNKEYERHHVVVNGPDERRETVTQRTETETETEPREYSFSAGTVALLVALALLAILITVYVVTNKNANEAANRQAMLEAAQTNKEQQPPPPAVVPPAQQAPVIVQPAPPPVIVQQPAQSGTKEGSALDDLSIQELATKRLSDNPNLIALSVTVSDGKATLIGTVDAPELKAQAERVVKGVRGVKSVENRIVVAKP